MFRMMKLHQNVKGKVLSFAVSLSVLALTIVGAFAVSFKRAAATPSNTIYTWSDLADLVYDVYPDNEIVQSFFDFFSGSGSVNNALDFDIFNNNSWLVIAALGSEPSEIAISVWEWTNAGETHTDGWSVRNDTWIMKSSSSSGYVYNLKGYFFSNISGYHCNQSRANLASYNITSSSAANDVFSWSPVQESQRYWTLMPNTYNITNANWTWLTSRPVYNTNSTVINYPQTLVGAPISRYNNVCFSIGNQYYFTFSDQSILQSFVQDSGSAYVPVTFQKNGSTVTYNYYFDELYYTGRSSVNGVTNVGAGGVLAWNITPLVNEYYFDSVVHSHVEPSEVYRDFFANNEAAISWVPYQDPAAQYEYYLEQFQNIVGHSYVANPNELPSYITSGNVGFSQDINAHVIMTGSSAGKIYFDSVAGQHAYNVNVTPSSVLILDAYMLTNDFDVNLLSSESFNSTFSGYLLNDVDMIIVVEDWEFLTRNVTRDYGNSGNNDLIPYQIMSSSDSDYFVHNSYYQDWNKDWHNIHFYFTKSIEDNFIPNERVNSISGYVFATNRYYTRICNAILAEGFNGLQNALDTITTNQNTFFTGTINSIGAAIYAIDTVGGKLDSIYKYLRYDVDLSDKLTKIVDNLEKIVNNTDEQTHDFWFISLYNWLLQFAPSNSDFVDWVSDITSFENSLPDPEATPGATVIPFPTVTSAAG